MSLELEARGGKEIQEKIKGLPPKIRRGTQQAMGKATLIVARDAIRDAPVDRGRYRASIGAKVRVMGGEIVGTVGSNVLYAPYIEFGRRPGKMPPAAVMEEWGRRVIGESGLGFVIARAIGRRGLRAKHILTNAIKRNRARIGRLLDGAISEVIREANR